MRAEGSCRRSALPLLRQLFLADDRLEVNDYEDSFLFFIINLRIGQIGSHSTQSLIAPLDEPQGGHDRWAGI